MTITRERFEQGMSYEAYKAQMTRNRDRLEANEATVVLSAADEAFFAKLPQHIHVLVITEDWCGDAMNNIPVLVRLARAGGRLDMRFFLRDQNPDLMAHYLKDGQHASIPVFVFFDAAFRELGHWIERPAVISAQQGAALAELFATAPELQGVALGTSPADLPEAARERVIQFFNEFRARTRAEADAAVARELRELLSQALAR